MLAATRTMTLSTMIFLILLIFGFYRGSYGLRPLIQPSASNIFKRAGESISFKCSGHSKIFFFYPINYAEEDPEIISSQPETKELEKNGIHTYNFTRHYALPGDTGWYGCAYYNVSITSEVYDDPEINWVYVYVTSANSSLVEENAMKSIKAINGGTAILPCRPTSPNLTVVLYNDDLGEKVELGENISYDPRFGFKMSHLRVRNTSIFKCVITRNGVDHDAIYHLYVCRNITVTEPIIWNNTLKHVTRAEYLHVNCTIDLETNIKHVFRWRTPHESDRISVNSYTIETGRNSFREIMELVIQNVTDEDEGEYECYISTCGGVTRKSTKTYLRLSDTKVNYIKLTSQDTKTRYTIQFREMVKWVVYVDAYPEPTLKWLDTNGKVIVNGWPEQSNPKYTISQTSSSTILTIHDLDIADIGTYKLQATNDNNTETLDFTLDVLAKPSPRIEEIKEYYKPGEIAEIHCNGTSNPQSNITWSFVRFPKYPSPNNWSLIELTNITEESKRNSFYSTAMIKVDFSGKIYCTACNSQGCGYTVNSIFVSDGNGGFGLIKPKEEIIKDDNITIICAASIYNYTNNLTWTKHDENGTIKLNERISIVNTSTPFTYRSILQIENVLVEDAGPYVCSAQTADGNFEKTEYELSVNDPRPPEFTKSNLNGRDLSIDLGTEDQKNIIFRCYATGMPTPNITWYKDGVMLTKNGRYLLLDGSRELYIEYLLEQDHGKYSCRASNRFGTKEDFINIMIKGKELSKGLITITAVLFIIVVILIVYFTIKFRREKILRKELLETGLMYFEEGVVECLNPDLTVDDQAELLPYDKKWEFPREGLKLGKQLGSGAFGVVMKGEAAGICEGEPVTTVAVKMVRCTTDRTYVRALASELKIMVHLGKHLNVVNLLGACTKNISKRELLVIVEYCRFGNLHNYLLRHRSDFINQIDPATGKFDPTIGIDLLMRTTSVGSNNRIKYAALSFSRSISASSETEMMQYDTGTAMDSGDVIMSPDGCILSNNSSQPGWRSNYRGDYKDKNLKPICSQDLISWAFQVACGMEYLSQRKVLHGDLAARNILLAEDNIVKICDFGLAKTMYKDDNYKKKGDGPLPIKWMAIESIRDRVFSTQSDVWSFGIVLWEFFTLAETPYPGMEAEKLYQKLIEGYRMEQPIYATSDVYKIILQCWKTNPILRPSFTELVESIGNLLEERVKVHYISLNTPYVHINRTILEGKNDYLMMMSAPDHEALSSPTHNYINSTTMELALDSAYLCMSPAYSGNASGISSSEQNPKKSRFEFPSVTSDSEDAVELSPMLKKEKDPYLKPVNVHEQRAEFVRQRQVSKNQMIDPGNDRDSGYANAPRNLHLIDLNEKRPDVDDEDDQYRTDSLSKRKEYNQDSGYTNAPRNLYPIDPNMKRIDIDEQQKDQDGMDSLPRKKEQNRAIITTPDNYVDVSKQKSELRRDMPNSFSNPSYIMMKDSEANQTKV